jgi:hypothetical protein
MADIMSGKFALWHSGLAFEEFKDFVGFRSGPISMRSMESSGTAAGPLERPRPDIGLTATPGLVIARLD